MQTDVLVIGAGAVGLSCAAELARRGRPPLVIERHVGPGQEMTSRNSEVIHAGLYYEPGTLKAELCVEGRERLYRYCQARRIDHRQVGKFVVATSESELARLDEIRALGIENGAGSLEIVDENELRRREPRVRAIGGLWSPETGIVDAVGLCRSLQAELEEADGIVAWGSEVVGLDSRPNGWRVEYRDSTGTSDAIDVGWVINAAGLGADGLAQRAGVDVDAAELRHYPCKGDYFAISPSLGELSRHLVYPVPVPGGLGIHLTMDLAGRFRAGPDVEWLSEPSLVVDPAKAQEFAQALVRYLPEITAADLTPDYAGIRPKLQPQGARVRDFHIAEAGALGAPGLINLLGIESPGLTSALAIGPRVADLVQGLA